MRNCRRGSRWPGLLGLLLLALWGAAAEEPPPKPCEGLRTDACVRKAVESLRAGDKHTARLAFAHLCSQAPEAKAACSAAALVAIGERDFSDAMVLAAQDCDTGLKVSCEILGVAAFLNLENTTALMSFRRSCGGVTNPQGCEAVFLLEEKMSLSVSDGMLNAACTTSDSPECKVVLGLLAFKAGKKAFATSEWKMACNGGDWLGCRFVAQKDDALRPWIEHLTSDCSSFGRNCFAIASSREIARLFFPGKDPREGLRTDALDQKNLANARAVVLRHAHDPIGAETELKLQCRTSNPAACTLIAIWRWRAHEQAEAKTWSTQACKKRSPSGCVLRAHIARTENDGAALDLYGELACKLGGASACADLQAVRAGEYEIKE
jgi:hypothetical protein